MKNSHLVISQKWIIKQDEFYEIDPSDKSIKNEMKFNNLFCQEDLLSIKKSDFKLDLGWYGGEKKGGFGLYLYKGTDWHNCQLLEKRSTNDYQLVIELINRLIKNVDTGLYDEIDTEFGSIDDYYESEIISVLNN